MSEAVGRRTPVGRADLLRLLVRDSNVSLEPYASLLGLMRRPDEPRRLEVSREVPRTSTKATDTEHRPKETVRSDLPQTPVPFFKPDFYDTVPDIEDRPPLKPPPPLAELPYPPFEPLANVARLRALLSDSLATLDRSFKVDTDAVVRAWSRGRLLRKWPRRKVRRWPRRVQVWRDRSRALVWLAADQAWVCDWLRTQMGHHAVQSLVVDDALAWAKSRLVAGTRSDTPVLALSDLGAYDDGPERRRQWDEIGRNLRARQVNATALLPVPARYRSKLGLCWRTLAWESSIGAAPSFDDESVETILDFLSLAARVERGLVRAVRRLSEFGGDIGTEAKIWNHPEVNAHVAGLSLTPLAARRRRAQLRALEKNQQATVRAVFDLIRQWHRNRAPRGVWETEALAGAMLDVLEPNELAHARYRLYALLEDQARGELTEAEQDAIYEWTARAAIRDAAACAHSGAADERNPLLELVARNHAEDPSFVVPEGVTLEDWNTAKGAGSPGLPPRVFDLAQNAYGLHRRIEDDESSSPVVTIERRIPGVTLQSWAPWGAGQGVSLAFRPGRGALRDPFGVFCPSWGKRAGWDAYGFWVDVEVTGISFRMRWIEPGIFTMGSAKAEEGRGEAEGPQHQVTISSGFWLADTPCTQEIYEAVMRSNPSRFKSPQRPVEQVSWEDTQVFIKALNKRVPGLELTLPTEAEWEYACRAGTASATYVGALDILGDNNAPALDNIAWYGGNSGVDFDLDNGADSSGWQDKQYAHERAGTRLVGQKRPNPWGLYDMLGNVEEWCLDGRRDFSSEAQQDPVGPTDVGGYRVIRGGSWVAVARDCRAATATRDHPSRALVPGFPFFPRSGCAR